MLHDRLNVLLVDDNENDFVLVRDLLRDIDTDRFVLEWVRSYGTGLKAVQAVRHDLILLDFCLSDGTGLELLQETQALARRAPVIFMTRPGNHAVDVQAMQAGAADYIVKDRLDADTLGRAIRYAVERQRSANALTASEDRCRASEDRYRAFVENNTEGFWCFGVVPPLPTHLPEEEQIAHLRRFARIAECNDAAARAYGFDCAADILGTPLGDFFSPSPSEDSEDGGCLSGLVRANYQATGQDAFSRDTLSAGCPGRARRISHTLTGSVESGLLHRVWGTLTNITDVTERTRAEEALHQQNSLSRIASKLTHVGGWVVELSDRKVFWSDEIFDILDYPHGVMPTLAEALALYPAPWRATISAAMEACAQHGIPFDVEVKILTHKGREIWVRACAEAKRDADGAIRQLLGAFQDITERKRTEDAQAQLAAIVEASADAIISKTLDGLIVTWNKGAEAMYGYTAQEVIGKSASLLSDSHTPEQMNFILERIRRGEQVAQLEAVRRHKDGKLIHVSLTASPIVDVTGQITGASVIVRDISERKRVEAELAAAAARNERIAATLQRSMLQEVPAGKFPGIAVERFYAAAMDEAEVGGDFFDSFALSAGKVALVVGDVTGKGLAAAARSAEVKYALRAFLHDHKSPELALFHLNTFICGTHRLDPNNAEVFVVLALAVIDTVTGETTFSAAGAESTLILRADGRAEPVEITGTPLGIRSDASYTAKTRLLASGETVVMATDGITEARRGHAFLGVEGMAKLAEKAGPSASLLELSEAIYCGARDFASGDLHDDVCLLLTRRWWSGDHGEGDVER